MNDALRSDDEGPTSIPKYGTTSAPESLSKVLNHPQLHAQIREIAQNEARRIYALEIDKSFLKSAKGALLGAFQNAFESASDGIKEASLHFVESELADSALHGVPEVILDRNIEKWAQSQFFINVFARRALISMHFLRPVAKCSSEKVEKESEKVEETKKIA